MPTIFVNGPPQKDISKRRVLVKEIADTVEKVYGVPRDAIIVIIREDEGDHVAKGGKLLTEK